MQPRDIATATATFGFTRNMSTSIAVVIGGVIFQNSMAKRRNTLRAGLPPEVASALGGGSAGASTGIVKSLPPGQKDIATRAYTDSLKTMWILFVAMAALGLCCSLAIGKQKLSKTHEVQKQGLEAQEIDRARRKVEHDARSETRKNRDAEKRLNGSRSRDGRGKSDAEKGLKSVGEETKEGDI